MSHEKTYRIGRKNYRIDRTEPPAVLVEDSGTWRRLTRGELLERKAGSKFWKWLRSEGVRRPSPSGTPGGTQSYESRTKGRTAVQVFLSDDAIEVLDELVERHGSRRVAIETVLLQHRERK